ncbi:MAG: ATP-binding cassette domain-containing protein [Candidatus Acidiferrales bacterium]
MQSLLQIRHLSIQYAADSREPFAAVEDVSFDIAPGETLGLMGESGCGKSSIALALMGLLPKQQADVAGSVVFRGSNLFALSERELQRIRGAAISIVYQEPEIALSPVMRVGDQIAEVIRAHLQRSWKQCRTEVRAMLARVGFAQIERICNAYPHQLSGGQRQRVELAQALACEPALLIADEPTAHLDLRSQSEFLALLETLKRESGISMLLISHTPEVQARMADRLLVMRAGRIIERGRLSEIARSSHDPYTRAILGSAPGQLSVPDESTAHMLEEALAR